MWTEKAVSSFRFRVFSRSRSFPYARSLTPETGNLLTVQFDDQLLVDRLLDIFALGQGAHRPLEPFAINRQPVRRVLMRRKLFRLLKNSELAAAFLDRNLFTHAD